MPEKVWVVYSGRPSWHQQRAGHAYSGSMVWHSKAEADEYLARCKAHRPDEPAIIIEEIRD